jgi:parallel beta-helix repeat protein
MNFKVLIGAFFALTIAVVGCDSESTDNGGTGGSGGSGGSAGSGGGAGGGGGTPVPKDCANLGGTGMYSIQGAPATPNDDCDTTLTPSGGDDTAALVAALEDAVSGDIICLGMGTFDVRGTLAISSAAQITLKGIGASPDEVILDYAAAVDVDGIDASTPGFTIENLWIKNTPKDSVIVRADDATFRKLFVTWDAGSVLENGKYGIFPRGADNVLIEYSEVIGASDAGIYVGQCLGGIIRNNKAFGNVAGIEVENSANVEVYDNEAYDNTSGILAFQLTGLSRDADNVLIRDNDIYCNNRANFAAEGSIVADVPAGTGVLVLAGENFEFRNNLIDGNISTGVLIASHVVLCQLNEERLDCESGWPDGFDPYPTKMFLNDNVFINNGQDPQGFLGQLAEEALMVDTLEDVVWDGYIAPDVTDPEICLGLTDLPSYRDMSDNKCGNLMSANAVGFCMSGNSNTRVEERTCTLDELVIPIP